MPSRTTARCAAQGCCLRLACRLARCRLVVACLSQAPATVCCSSCCQALGEAEQRHGGKVGRLKDAIASLEKSERQLLKARAVLGTRVEELEAALAAAEHQAAAAAEASQLAVATAVAAAHTQLQQRVRWGWGVLVGAAHSFCMPSTGRRRGASGAVPNCTPVSQLRLCCSLTGVPGPRAAAGEERPAGPRRSAAGAHRQVGSGGALCCVAHAIDTCCQRCVHVRMRPPPATPPLLLTHPCHAGSRAPPTWRPLLSWRGGWPPSTSSWPPIAPSWRCWRPPRRRRRRSSRAAPAGSAPTCRRCPALGRGCRSSRRRRRRSSPPAAAGPPNYIRVKGQICASSAALSGRHASWHGPMRAGSATRQGRSGRMQGEQVATQLWEVGWGATTRSSERNTLQNKTMLIGASMLKLGPSSTGCLCRPLPPLRAAHVQQPVSHCQPALRQPQHPHTELGGPQGVASCQAASCAASMSAAAVLAPAAWGVAPAAASSRLASDRVACMVPSRSMTAGSRGCCSACGSW